MANNYLITGYWGEPHVTPENDRGIHAGLFGTGRFVLPVGEQFRAEYIGNNTVRMYDGKLMDNGAAAGIPAGKYVDLLIANASSGFYRNDIIAFRYTLDNSTLIERGEFVVIRGEEDGGEGSDPTYAQNDLLSDTAKIDYMPLWRVCVHGSTISAPEKMFTLSRNMAQAATDASTARSTAEEANRTATSAQTAANTAASNAQTSANSAKSSADSAKSSADSALAAATSAQSAANAANEVKAAADRGDFDGAPGEQGTPGKSAYQYAQEGGYEGTEADFSYDMNPDRIKAEATPQKGVDYTDGTNGTSVTVSKVTESTASGGSNVVTFSDGKTLTVKNGKDGTNGTNGTNGKSAYQYAQDGGYTGTEAAFAEDINPDNINANSVNFISTELAKRGQLKPEFANDVSECTDTSKLYVLPDGYIYGYGKFTTPTEGEPIDILTNSFSLNGKNYIAAGTTDNARLSSNSGDVSSTALDGYVTFGHIPVYTGQVIRISGMTAPTNTSTYSYIGLYDSNKTYTSGNIGNFVVGTDFVKADRTINIQGSGTTIVLTCTSVPDGSFIRVCGLGEPASCTVTIDGVNGEGEPITTYGWANTGHAFVPADYEARIIDLEKDVSNLKTAADGGDSSDTVTVPLYWESMVKAKTEAVKALQAMGGKNCVSFAWASDPHIPDNDNGRTNDLGKVMAKMLDNCEIPFAVLSGDINTRSSQTTEAGLVNAQAQMPIHLAPLWGTDKLLMALGNHDGCWGDSTGYYKKQFTPERMWEIYFRGQALDFRRVFSDDGLYFYVDNIPQKTRFIVLNSQFGGEYAEDENGFAVNDRFATSRYGAEQLTWLAYEALDMPEGYSAIIVTHVPPNLSYTVDRNDLKSLVYAYNNKTMDMSGSVSVDFSEAKGEIVAIFAGHIHWDKVDTTTMACPIITIMAAGASVNETHMDEGEVAPTRTEKTDTETSFDVVTINKSTRKIYCTRIGAGVDREISY